MSILIKLDEIEFAKEVKDGKHNYLNIYGVSKYLTKLYKYEKEKNDKKIEIDNVVFYIIDFLKENDIEFNIDRDFEKIKNKVKQYLKTYNPIINVDGVKITKGELEKISEIKNEHLEVLAFVILVLTKVYNIKHDRESSMFKLDNRYYYNKYTKSSRNNFKQNKAIGKLVGKGYLKMPSIEKWGETQEVELTYIDFNENDYEILIDDFREIDLIYLKWKGENIIQCTKCSRLVKVKEKGRKPKYCKLCQEKLQKEHQKESMKRLRKQQNK